MLDKCKTLDAMSDICLIVQTELYHSIASHLVKVAAQSNDEKTLQTLCFLCTKKLI